jgi:hypothetical protein
MAMLVGLGVVATAWLRWRLRRPAQRSDHPKASVPQGESQN